MKGERITSNSFRFGKEVRQGDILSPILFNIYGEYIIRHALKNKEGDVSLSGTRIKNLRFADDTTLVIANEAEMADLMVRLEQINDTLGLKIYLSKTKLMVIDHTITPHLTDALSHEKVDEFIISGFR